MKLILASCIGWYFKTKTPEKAVWYEKKSQAKKIHHFHFHWSMKKTRVITSCRFTLGEIKKNNKKKKEKRSSL